VVALGQVCLLCFDMSQPSTLDHTVWWKRKVSDHNPKCLFILVGTKEDLVNEDAFDMSTISRWAEENGIPYFPLSALKGGPHVKFLLHTVAEKCVRLNRERQLENSSFDTVKNLILLLAHLRANVAEELATTSMTSS